MTFIDFLVKEKTITTSQADTILRLAEEQEKKPGDIILSEKLLPKEDLLRYLQQYSEL